jgi:hypothetical protein
MRLCEHSPVVTFCSQVFGIVCMACASPAYLSGTHWFLFVAVISFIATLIWIFIYFLSVREALKLPINWILTVRSRACQCPQAVVSGAAS